MNPLAHHYRLVVIRYGCRDWLFFFHDGQPGVLIPEALGYGNWVSAQKWAAIPDGQATYLGQPVPWGTLPIILAVEAVAIAFVESQRNGEPDPEKRKYPGGAFDPLGFSKDASKLEEFKLKEVKNGKLAVSACPWIVPHITFMNMASVFCQLISGDRAGTNVAHWWFISVDLWNMDCSLRIDCCELFWRNCLPPFCLLLNVLFIFYVILLYDCLLLTVLYQVGTFTCWGLTVSLIYHFMIFWKCWCLNINIVKDTFLCV